MELLFGDTASNNDGSFFGDYMEFYDLMGHMDSHHQDIPDEKVLKAVEDMLGIKKGDAKWQSANSFFEKRDQMRLEKSEKEDAKIAKALKKNEAASSKRQMADEQCLVDEFKGKAKKTPAERKFERKNKDATKENIMKFFRECQCNSGGFAGAHSHDHHRHVTEQDRRDRALALEYDDWFTEVDVNESGDLDFDEVTLGLVDLWAERQDVDELSAADAADALVAPHWDQWDVDADGLLDFDEYMDEAGLWGTHLYPALEVFKRRAGLSVYP